MPHMVCVARFMTLHLACQSPLIPTPSIPFYLYRKVDRSTVVIRPVLMTLSPEPGHFSLVVADSLAQKNHAEKKRTSDAPEGNECSHVSVM